MSIQAIIDAAQSGDTVNIPPGIYSEQLLIDKPLTLVGPDPAMGEAVVDAAGMAALPTLLVTSSQVTVRLITFQNGPGQGIRVGTAAYPNLEEVLIENCIVKGHNLSGIMNINSSAMDVVGNLIENNGAISSFERAGIFLRPHGKMRIANNRVRANNGDGVYAEGSIAGLLIENNTIEDESFSGITLAWDEQNVAIEGNTISRCGSLTDELKGGIIIIQSMAERITGNTIDSCNQRGIMWGWVPSTGPAPANILISANRISRSSFDAIYLFSQGPGSFIPPDPFPLKPLISNNNLSENNRAGVFISNNFESSPHGNADPHLDCNDIQGNDWGAFNATTTIVNAVNNWWGDSSGPFHPALNPGGTGDAVSDNIDFIPWCVLPPTIEVDCIRVTKVYWSCKKPRVNEEIIDVSEIAVGDLISAQCYQVDLMDDELHHIAVKKIPGADRVRVSFYFRYRVRFMDSAGWKVVWSRPVFHEEIFSVPPPAEDRRIQAVADVYLKCLECFVSGPQQVTCCIGTLILLQLVSPVQLLVPTYGFCPDPDYCTAVQDTCPGFNPFYSPYPL